VRRPPKQLLCYFSVSFYDDYLWRAGILTESIDTIMPEPSILPVHSSDEISPEHGHQPDACCVASTSPSTLQRKCASSSSQSPTHPDASPQRRTNTLSPLKAPPALPPTPGSSTGPTGTGIARINVALASSRNSRDGVIPRKYRNREHIFAKVVGLNLTKLVR
jgi:hypothetical protein